MRLDPDSSRYVSVSSSTSAAALPRVPVRRAMITRCPQESGLASFKTPAIVMFSRGGIHPRRSGSSGSYKLTAAGFSR